METPKPHARKSGKSSAGRRATEKVTENIEEPDAPLKRPNGLTTRPFQASMELRQLQSQMHQRKNSFNARKK